MTDQPATTPAADARPCPSTALAILGAVDLDGAWLRCGYIQGHYGQHVFELRWRDPEHDREPPTDPRLTVREDIKRYLDSRRSDPDLMRRLTERIAEDAEILKRLEADDA